MDVSLLALLFQTYYLSLTLSFTVFLAHEITTSTEEDTLLEVGHEGHYDVQGK